MDKANYIDPNWFYSALAQSSAAIVGIMGAFMIAEITNKRTRLFSLKQNIDEVTKQINILLKEIEINKNRIQSIEERKRRKNTFEYLNEISTQMNVNDPPGIEKLIDDANNKYRLIDIDLLRSEYEGEYLEKVKARGITYFKVDFPTQYMDTYHSKIYPIYQLGPNNEGISEYQEYKDKDNALNTKLNILNEAKERNTKQFEHNDNFRGLIAIILILIMFSLIGVFIPLIIMNSGIKIMNSFKWPLLTVVILFWFIIIFILIKGSGNKGI